MKTLNIFTGLPTVSLLLFVTACVHTDVVQEVVSTGPKTVHKVLVCSLSSDSEREARMEFLLMKRLSRHHVQSESCLHWMTPVDSMDIQKTISRLTQDGFDSVLVIKRGSSSVETSAAVDTTSSPQIATMETFLKEYGARTSAAQQKTDSAAQTVDKTAPVTERAITGTAELIGIREDNILWAIGGTVKGSLDKPIEEFLKSVADQTEDGLLRDGLLPRK